MKIGELSVTPANTTVDETSCAKYCAVRGLISTPRISPQSPRPWNFSFQTVGSGQFFINVVPGHAAGDAIVVQHSVPRGI